MFLAAFIQWDFFISRQESCHCLAKFTIIIIPTGGTYDRNCQGPVIAGAGKRSGRLGARSLGGIPGFPRHYQVPPSLRHPDVKVDHRNLLSNREMENLLRVFTYLVVATGLFLSFFMPRPARAAGPVAAWEDPDTQRAMIAVRDFSTVLGGRVDWEEATRTVTIQVYGRPALHLDLNNGTLAGKPLKPRPLIKDGVTYAPLRVIAEALGARVEWREDGIHVYTPAGKPVDITFIHRLGQYTITFPAKEAGGPGLHNARLAGRYLNGAIVAPGEVLSFNNTVGPRTAAKGFVPGIIFMGDDKIPEIGGGVCRTATLLHNAVLAAGLEVVERHRHGQPVTYVPPGYDATVYYGILDYRFRNNRPVPIKLEFNSWGSSISMAVWELG